MEPTTNSFCLRLSNFLSFFWNNPKRERTSKRFQWLASLVGDPPSVNDPAKVTSGPNKRSLFQSKASLAGPDDTLLGRRHFSLIQPNPQKKKKKKKKKKGKMSNQVDTDREENSEGKKARKPKRISSITAVQRSPLLNDATKLNGSINKRQRHGFSPTNYVAHWPLNRAHTTNIKHRKPPPKNKKKNQKEKKRKWPRRGEDEDTPSASAQPIQWWPTSMLMLPDIPI